MKQKLLKTIPYKNRENAFITIAKVDEPYGSNTESVLSIGCTLKGDIENPSWVVHIPMYMAEELAQILREHR
tara:strand:- start:80 stop:295 length:216 start_codon:yes stop_codon:yes gene_type:complete